MKEWSDSKESPSPRRPNDLVASMSRSITASDVGMSLSSPASHFRSSPLASPYAMLDSTYRSITRTCASDMARRMSSSLSRRFSAIRACRVFGSTCPDFRCPDMSSPVCVE